ncbi:hypothetical protein GQ44DRAFT_337301 [Phaeosphaeriaceae sp. PMI808]|nr:hypothetical protein GQ44DRAFT_337301 [Phaeosphaeriaceae sp. PMI808]
MEKIKSVLHGHKKSEDATHDAHTSLTGSHSTGAHHDGQPHPIYNQMTGKDSVQPTNVGTTMSAGQTGTTTGLAQGGHRSTEAPLDQQHQTTRGPLSTGTHGTITSDDSRPRVGPAHDTLSSASIKSGVIGFGTTGNGHDHAVLPSRQNHEAQLDRNQILGGGNLSTSGNTATGPTAASTSNTQGLPLPVTSSQPHTNIGSIFTPSNTQQESYTKDTDRSFPLAGGVTSKHGSSTTHSAAPLGLGTQNPIQQTSSTHHTAPLLGGIAPKHDSSATHSTEPHGLSSSTHPLATSDRELGTKEKGADAQDGHGREALAGAAAAAAAVGVGSHLHHKDAQTQGHDSQPLATSTGSTNSTTNHPTSGLTGDNTTHPTSGPHPDALAAATAAATKPSNTRATGFGTHDSSLSGTTQPLNAGVLAGERPIGTRSASHRHIPGEFPSPTPDESKTFLYYRDDIVPEPGATTAGTATSTAGPHTSDALNKADPRVDSDLGGSKTVGGTTAHQDFSNTTAAPLSTGAGQHELRHTGSLDQPQSRTEDHHHGRDAALAAGLAAGAAGLAYGAHQKHDTSDVHGSTLPHEPSPYSAKQLDPRVTGGKAPLEMQRFDPQAKVEPHHALQTSNPTGIASSSTQGPNAGVLGSETATAGPRLDSKRQTEPQSHHGGAAAAGGLTHGSRSGHHNDPVESKPSTIDPYSTTTEHDGPQSHHSWDAALLGGSAATAAGIHHATKNDHHGDAVGTEKSTTGRHKSSLLNKLDPRVHSDKSKASPDTTNVSSAPTTTKHDELQSHHDRDAALVAGGVATAGGAHKALQRESLQRNDTPGAGTAVLPSQSSTTTAHQHGSNVSAPLAASSSDPHSPSHTSPLTGTASAGSERTIDASTGKNAGGHKTYSRPLTTDGTPFYGAVGAPAPTADTKSFQHGQPTVVSSEKDHHHGRDAALVGAGAATAGGLAHTTHHDKRSDTVPTTGNTAPHYSATANVVDPRVQSNPTHHGITSTTGPTTTTTTTTTSAGPHYPSTLNQTAPHKDQHQFSRDAAVLGGTGAAGYGAYEAAKAYSDHRSTQPGASMNDQRFDPASTGATTTSNPVLGSGHHDGGAAFAGQRHGDGQYGLGSSQPLGASAHQAPLASSQHNDHHGDNTGRNLALGPGAALGAGGLGGAAYAGHKHGDAQHVPATSGQPLASSHPPHNTFGQKVYDPSTSTYPQQGTLPHNTQDATPGTMHNRYDSIQDPHHKDDHTKRDAALAGTAGAATAGGAAYAYSHHQDKAEQDRLKKEQHQHDKEQHKLEKEQHKHEKEQHKHDKDTAEPDKKHGILSFLHRDKTKKDKSSADTSPRHSAEVRRSSDDPDSPAGKRNPSCTRARPRAIPRATCSTTTTSWARWGSANTSVLMGLLGEGVRGIGVLIMLRTRRRPDMLLILLMKMGLGRLLILRVLVQRLSMLRILLTLAHRLITLRIPHRLAILVSTHVERGLMHRTKTITYLDGYNNVDFETSIRGGPFIVKTSSRYIGLGVGTFCLLTHMQ